MTISHVVRAGDSIRVLTELDAEWLADEAADG